MSWFPTFLNFWPALAAAALVVPLLLVLYFLKLRRREMSIASTLLWRKAIQDMQVNAPFQRLRRNLLLLLQLLLLVLLCLALARPVANLTKGAGRLTVILIDRSAPMGALDHFGGEKHTRLEEAKKQAKALLDSMGRHDTAAVIAFDDSAQIICPLTTDVQRLRQAIDSIQQTDRKSRLKTAYKLAEAQEAYYPEQLRPNITPTVFLYSDGRVLDADTLSINADLNYEKIGSDDLGNIAVVALSAERNPDKPTEVQVFARLANFGPEVVKGVDVVLSVDGQMQATANDLVLFPQRWSEEQRRKAETDQHLVARESVFYPSIELLSSAVIRIEQMHKEGDALACDDSAYIVVPPPRRISVLLVSDSNPFLERAVEAIKSLKKVAKATPAEYEAGVDPFDVIIFDRYAPQKLPDAGNFIFFGCVSPELRVKAVQERGKNVILTNNQTTLDWNRDHPILRGLQQLGSLYVAQSLKLEVPREAEVLIQGYSSPLMVLDRQSKRTSLIVGFDVLESNWPLRPSFPTVMYNAIQFLALNSQMELRQSYPPGATLTIPRSELQKLAPIPAEIRLSGPGLSRVLKVPETGDFVLPSLDKVGLYTTEPAVPGFEQIAVNLLDANESNLVCAMLAPGDPQAHVDVVGGKVRMELWWWIVTCAALPLLLLEWWVYTRRVHM